MNDLENILPHVNAALNSVATVLLVVGFVFIKRAQRSRDREQRLSLETAHKWTMLACFAVSVLFLACYLYYHLVVMDGLSKKFPTDAGPVRFVYYAILLSHVVLAAAVPFLAVGTIYFGLRDIRSAHRKLARWTFPIWLYVSVTGVAVYVMLYQIYAPQ
jgi:uncharacterized membrane protein YozB (DUF420 family)